MPAIDLDVVAAVVSRDWGACIICGRPAHGGASGADWTIHRRSPAGDALANLVLLCGSATASCTGRAAADPAWSERLGLTVPAPADPAAVPVHWHGRLVLLTRDGDAVDTTPINTVVGGHR